MKNINDNDIRKHLKQAVNSLEPDSKAEEIWKKPVKKATGTEWYLEGTQKTIRKLSNLYKIMGAVAACFILMTSLSLGLTMRTFSTVYLDVNPSISLKMNRAERVIKAESLNEDGKIILSGMDLKNTDVNVAVNTIIGSMVKNGYLDEKTNTVLLSVESKNSQKADELSNRISDDIELCIDEMLGQNTVYYQSVDRKNKEIKKVEKQYHVSRGKAALLIKIREKHPELDMNKISALSIEELVTFLSDSKINIDDYVNVKTNVVKPETASKDDKDDTKKEENKKEQVDEDDAQDGNDDEDDDQDDINEQDDTNEQDDLDEQEDNDKQVGHASQDDSDDRDDSDDWDDDNSNSNNLNSANSNNSSSSNSNYVSQSNTDDSEDYDSDDYDYEDSYDDDYESDDDDENDDD